MIHALSPAGVAALHAQAVLEPLVALDFDGTLAPLVDDPREARMPERTAALLRRVALAFPCAVISGRSRGDVASRLGDAPLVAVFGNHGAELDSEPPRAVLRGRVRAWASALRDSLRTDPGVEVENKEFTIAVHYRRARSPAEAERRIRSLVAGLPGARVSGGHAVVNVAPSGSRTKGDALAILAGRLRPPAIVYVGDDDTDEDAFGAPEVSLAVRVGRSEASAAPFFLRDQGEIDDWLATLADARPRGGRGADAARRRLPSPFDGDSE